MRFFNKAEHTELNSLVSCSSGDSGDIALRKDIVAMIGSGETSHRQNFYLILRLFSNSSMEFILLRPLPLICIFMVSCHKYLTPPLAGHYRSLKESDDRRNTRGVPPQKAPVSICAKFF